MVERWKVWPQATGRNRIVFATIVMILGVGAGVGLGAALALVRPVIDSVQLLRRLWGFPVLGSVALVPGIPGSINHRAGLAMFTLLGIGLVGMYGALLVLFRLDINLVQELVLLKSHLLTRTG